MSRKSPSTPPAETEQLQVKLSRTEARLAEAEEILRAIRGGEVDALVVAGPDGDRVFTLQGAETPYRWLVEEMNEGALLVSAEGTILYANARFARLAETRLEAVIGSSWTRFFVAAGQPGLEPLLGAAARGGLKRETTLQTAGGTARPVEISLAWMQRQALEAYSVVVTDLTERKAAEESLHASNARLRDMVQEFEHFSYSISHDMRAPLRAMKSFAVMLEQDCDTCEHGQNRELLARISAAASRLDRLIQGSLDYAQVVKAKLVLEPVDIAKLIRSLCATYPNLSPAKADFQIQGALPVVLGNEAALTQVFSNLLDNAVKFVAPGTRASIRIWAESAQTDNSPERKKRIARVWVADNGIGIPKRSQNRIFELFQRLTRDYEGTGIGLAVVRKMVERMGGRVGVESEEHQGSRFWVELQTAG